MRSKVVLVLPFWQLTQIRTLNCGPLTHRIVIKHSFFVAINFFFLALMFSVILVPTIADLQPKLTFDFDCLGDLLSRIFIRMVHGKNNLNLPWEICVAGAMKYTQKIQNEHWGYSPSLLHVCWMLHLKKKKFLSAVPKPSNVKIFQAKRTVIQMVV